MSANPPVPRPIPCPIQAAAWRQIKEMQPRPVRSGATVEVDRPLLYPPRATIPGHTCSLVIVAHNRIPAQGGRSNCSSSKWPREPRSLFSSASHCALLRHGDIRGTFAGFAVGLRGVFGYTARHGDGLHDGGYRAFGVFPVFHAERVVLVPPATAGARPRHLELPNAVWHEEDTDRQLHPFDAGPCLPGGLAALLRPGLGAARAARRAEGLSAAGRADVGGA